jgi:hypothetical protein
MQRSPPKEEAPKEEDDGRAASPPPVAPEAKLNVNQIQDLMAKKSSAPEAVIDEMTIDGQKIIVPEVGNVSVSQSAQNNEELLDQDI